jgi:hypothetical protein
MGDPCRRPQAGSHKGCPYEAARRRHHCIASTTTPITMPTVAVYFDVAASHPFGLAWRVSADIIGLNSRFMAALG